MTIRTNSIITSFSIGQISRSETIIEQSIENKTKTIWKNFLEGLVSGTGIAIASFAFSVSLISSIILVVTMKILINQGKM